MSRQLASVTKGRTNSTLGSSPTVADTNTPHSLASAPTLDNSKKTFKSYFLGPGVVIDGRYEILKEIGAGGMSTVYGAVDHDTGDAVAVKILKSTGYEEETILRSLRSELMSAHLSLRPGTTPEILNYGITPHCIIMEQLKGVDLDAYSKKNLKDSKIPYLEATMLILAAADAVAELHKFGIVHRDLKPANIFACNDEEIRLLDLGLARTLVNNKVRDSFISGTVEFGAPEQFVLGRDSESLIDETIIDVRADVYGLGSTLYTLLSGKFTHNFGSDVAENVRLKTTKLPNRITDHVSIPRELELILLKSLEISPKDRYQSVGEFIHALSEFVDNDSPQITIETNAKPPSFINQFVELINRGATALKKSMPRIFN